MNADGKQTPLMICDTGRQFCLSKVCFLVNHKICTNLKILKNFKYAYPLYTIQNQKLTFPISKQVL
jgi:hypothetical protein